MIFGLTVEKLLVIGVIAAMILGPERLPRYAAMLAQFAARTREYVNSAKGRLREEVGDDVDWRSLDPRQYDPRRIMRQALLDDTPVIAHTPAPALAAKQGGEDDDNNSSGSTANEATQQHGGTTDEDSAEHEVVVDGGGDQRDRDDRGIPDPSAGRGLRQPSGLTA